MRQSLQLVYVNAAHTRSGAVHEVEGRSLEELRTNARDLLASRGYRVRSLSFTPTGLLAYVADPEA
jgi:hypothetical protein